MTRRIAIIVGHPDAGTAHFTGVLADAYARTAAEAGHSVRRIDLAQLDFPLVRSKQEWIRGETPPPIREAQETIRWAEHLVFFYPLWLGEFPALFKGFLEQVMRPGFGVSREPGGRWKRLLSGRSARIVVTMGMPAFVYRWYFRAHSLKSFKRNILEFCGIAPVRASIIGMVEGSAAARTRGIARMEALGRRAR